MLSRLRESSEAANAGGHGCAHHWRGDAIPGRLLTYVWLPDRTLFNMVIMREGYAQIITIQPNVKYADLFLACQREAREERRGLWSK